jgi:iron-sulfur cluster assembly protein
MTTETQTPEKSIVTATPAAVAELKRLIGNEPEGVTGVRMAVKGGGCSGLSYVLEFDKQRDGDNMVLLDGVRVYMDRKSTIYLKGIQLDFKEGLKGKGFVFQNPNATSTCGCGESFSV